MYSRFASQVSNVNTTRAVNVIIVAHTAPDFILVPYIFNTRLSTGVVVVAVRAASSWMITVVTSTAGVGCLSVFIYILIGCVLEFQLCDHGLKWSRRFRALAFQLVAKKSTPCTCAGARRDVHLHVGG